MSSNGGEAPKPRAGLSLYASLLDQTPSGSTISAAPVKYNQSSEQTENANKQQVNAAALRFQPSKRPAASTLKSKPKTPAVISKPPVPATTTTTAATATVPTATVPDPGLTDTPAKSDSTGRESNVNKAPTDERSKLEPYRSTLQDWADDDGEDAGEYYRAQKHQRGGRKKRKKQQNSEPKVIDWDAIYDPTRPNAYEDYKHSEEKYNEIFDWKRKLKRAPRKRDGSTDRSSDQQRRPTNPAFAPPSSYNFAPPASFDDEPTAAAPPPPPPAVDVVMDATGEDAYAQRMRLSSMAATPSDTTPRSPPPPPSAPAPATIPAATISRAPVRYTLPEAPPELPRSEDVPEDADITMPDADAEPEPEPEGEAPADARSTTRPGQKGFAERLLSKYGWTKGSGLGANATGIVKPLQVKVDKRVKRPDAEGGGFVGPAGKGNIIGGSKSKAVRDAERQAEEKYGTLSPVVLLRGMVKGLDLERELAEGSLMQDIGEECGSKYGRVERVFVDRGSEGQEDGANVFVKFTAELSALRAVQALDGRLFNGNAVRARYFDLEKFEKGHYQE